MSFAAFNKIKSLLRTRQVVVVCVISVGHVHSSKSNNQRPLMVRDSKETKSCELLEAKLLIPVQA